MIAAAIGIACADDRAEGDRCRDEPDVCIDGDALWACSAGSWKYIDCDYYCGQQELEAVGCLVGETRDACHCVDPDAAESCIASEAPPTCVGSNVLETCIDGEIQREHCNGPCSLQDRWSAGCFYDDATGTEACLCVEPGEPCVPVGYPVCLEVDALLHCAADGHWMIDSCTDLCAPAAAVACLDDAVGIDSCLCDGG